MHILHRTETPLCWPQTILFYRCSLDLSFFLFSLPNLWGRLASHHQTLPHVHWWPRFIKFGQKFGWTLYPTIWRPKNIKILARYCTTWQLDREYLQNTTRHHQSENGFANYGHSCTGKLNSVYFGPHMAKNRSRVLTHPRGGNHAGHATHLVLSFYGVFYCQHSEAAFYHLGFSQKDLVTLLLLLYEARFAGPEWTCQSWGQKLVHPYCIIVIVFIVIVVILLLLLFVLLLLLLTPVHWHCWLINRNGIWPSRTSCSNSQSFSLRSPAKKIWCKFE